MKKIITLIISVICFLNFINVEAYYNGEGGSFTPKNGNGDCGTAKNCQYNNSNVFYLKLTLYYIDNGKFEKVENTKSYYIAGKDSRDYLINSTDVTKDSIYELPEKYQKQIDEITKASPQKWAIRYKEASKILTKCFEEKKENVENIMSKNLKKFLNEVTGNDISGKLYKESENANPYGSIEKGTAAKKGYRLVIEPVILYVNAEWANNGGAILTVKGTAKKRNNKTEFNSKSLPLVPTDGTNPQSQFLQIEFDDVGIKKQKDGYCAGTYKNKKGEYKGVTVAELADKTNGCGYNIIDVGKYITPMCYDPVPSVSTLKCVNKDSNNEAKFEEKYVKRKCKSLDEAETNTNTKYGKKIKETDNLNCAVYCKESAFASFPGHVSNKISLGIPGILSNTGTYFTWPSRVNDTNGMKMFMKSKLTCRIIQNDGKICTAEDIKFLKTAVESNVKGLEMSAELKAGTNNEINEELGQYNPEFSESWPESKNIKFDGNGVSSELWIEKKVYFKIKDGKNRLYNKESGNVKDGTIPEGIHVFDRGEGVISLKQTDDVFNLYNLEIKNVNLGSGNQFGESIKDYVCTYQLVSDPCVCPAGTVMEGTPLYNKLVEGKTCAELQRTSCNKCECPPPNDYKIKLVGEAATTQDCANLQKMQCYNNTGYCEFNGKTIDMTDCIKTQTETYQSSREEAIIYCEQTLCPECTDSYGNKHDLTECLSKGKPYSLCEQQYCPRPVCVDEDCYNCSKNCRWDEVLKTETALAYKKVCDDGENCGYIKMSCPAGNENMLNADSCVKGVLGVSNIQNALTQGIINENDVKRAFAACESQVCPYSGGRIVYRQIDINDPFPGKEHKGTSIETSMSNNNQNRKSRTPGENWDSTKLIDLKILNARGAKGYDLYNKDPLYIIELTPDTIKKIREYNKNNKYDDFKLTCTNKGATANCISDFLHKQGTIANLNPSDFIKTSYANKNSVSACYNMDYSENSFNKCYNENN